MSALNLYHNLIVQGFKLSINGDKIELVPASRLTDSQRTAIKQHKSELLLLLAVNDQETLKETDPDFYEFLYGKPTEELLFNHLIDCPYCHIKQAQYCLYGNELGKQYDVLLLKNEHAQERRAALSFQVDRAKITGNRRYMPFVPAPF